LQQIQNGFNDKWCCYYRCYQVCSDKQGELTAISNNQRDNSKESEELDYDEDKDQLEEKQEEQTGEITRTTINQVF
jgi:hypothetical protein